MEVDNSPIVMIIIFILDNDNDNDNDDDDDDDDDSIIIPLSFFKSESRRGAIVWWFSIIDCLGVCCLLFGV